MSKIVLIGANHAGTACANTILDTYKDNEVVIFDKSDNISFLGCGMALWIGKQIKGPEGLFYCSKDVFEKKGATVHMETVVESIDYDNKIVHAVDKNGKKIDESYDKLILATGSKPIIPNIKGIELENIQQVKLYHDSEDVINKIEHTKINNVAVIGGGYIGVELAEAFERLNIHILLIEQSDRVLSSYYDKEFTDLMEENLKEHNIELHLNEKVEEFEGKDGKVSKVVTDKGKYDVDMVILCCGFKPNTALYEGKLELGSKGAIATDKHQKTSLKDVFAVGDCTTIYYNAVDKEDYIALASNAVRSGIVAAHNACGTCIEANGVQGSNGIKIYDLCMVSTGLTVDTAKKAGIDVLHTDFEDLQKPAFMESNNEKVKIRIVYDKSTREIKGAQIASKYDISLLIHMFSLAIQEKVTIDKLALTDLFFLPHYNQAYNYVTMAAITAK